MTKIVLAYVQAFKDRHGKLRHYFRKPGCRRVALPGLPGSAEFMAAYAEADGGVTAPKRQIGSERTKPGSLSALIVAYYGSSDFVGLAETTQRARRALLESLRGKHGDKPVARLEGGHIRKMMDAKAATPEAANNLLKAFRMLMRFAVERGWRKDDPTAGIRKIRTASEGHVTWTEGDIAKFEAKWPIGTRERLALAILLHTGIRRSDLVGLGRQHIRDGKVHLRPAKTRGTSNVRIAIPIHPALREALDATDAANLTFLMTQYGAPFTAAGFGNWFAAAVRAAGLVGLSAHGLRKAVGRRLAEAGATAHEIMSVLGHTTLKEAELYTKAASREGMAASAMSRIGATGSEPEQVVVKPSREV